MRVIALLFLFVCSVAASEENKYQPEFDSLGNSSSKVKTKKEKSDIPIFYERPNRPYKVIDVIVFEETPFWKMGLTKTVRRRGGDAAYIVSKDAVAKTQYGVSVSVTAQVIKFSDSTTAAQSPQTELIRWGNWAIEKHINKQTGKQSHIAITLSDDDLPTARGMGVVCEEGVMRMAIHWGEPIPKSPSRIKVQIDKNTPAIFPYYSQPNSASGNFGYTSSNTQFSSLIDAMRRGDAIHFGLGQGQNARDVTFSLSGFSNIYDDLVQFCQN